MAGVIGFIHVGGGRCTRADRVVVDVHGQRVGFDATGEIDSRTGQGAGDAGSQGVGAQVDCVVGIDVLCDQDAAPIGHAHVESVISAVSIVVDASEGQQG